MKLFLHEPSKTSNLGDHYRRAFANAKELYIVSAYLTHWDKSLSPSKKCRTFRMIIGKDFGITKKAACRDVMKSLPAENKHQFLVYQGQANFHPKAIFWKESDGKSYAIIGSSNLTQAAFKTNYEANNFCKLSLSEFSEAREWVHKIEGESTIVSDDWLDNIYVETKAPPQKGKPNKPRQEIILDTFKLPTPKNAEGILKKRRKQLTVHKKKYEQGLIELFSDCESGRIKGKEFYRQLPQHWSWKIGNRFQAPGYERSGAKGNWRLLSKSISNIIKADEYERDEVVIREIDRLRNSKVPTRGSFLSEMLCLKFPEKYPVLNKPIEKYLSSIRYKAPKGASQGVRYIDLAQKLRLSLKQNPKHPAKNLAELDVIFFLEYANQA